MLKSTSIAAQKFYYSWYPCIHHHTTTKWIACSLWLQVHMSERIFGGTVTISGSGHG